MMSKITKLNSVNLREVWPHEAYNFTPWLAKNIDHLGEVIGLRLKDVVTEKTLGKMGRVDIFAKQAETDAIVVIENQIEESDHGHCLSLIGYAAVLKRVFWFGLQVSLSLITKKSCNGLMIPTRLIFMPSRFQPTEIRRTTVTNLRRSLSLNLITTHHLLTRRAQILYMQNFINL